MTNIFLKSIKFAIFLFVFAAPAYGTEYFVAPEGLDENPGTKEKPFLTIEKAIRAAENTFEENPDEDCTIWLSGGEFPLLSPLMIDSEYLRPNTGNLYIKNVPGENPVITGGVALKGWELLPDGLWKIRIPQITCKVIKPRELFIDGKRAIRARHPNDGYLRVKKAGEDRRTNFYFEPGDFPIPVNVQNTELVLLHDWSISRIRVKEINRHENKLTAIDSIGAKNPAFFNIDNWEPNPRYFLENAMEFLDADYEWLCDPDKNEIFLKLPADLTPDDLKIIIPVSEGLITFIGSENNPVKNIHFQGIGFRYSAWEIPPTGYCGVQACHHDPRPERGSWAVVPAAVQGQWISDCTFKYCVFENLGGSGLWLGPGSKNCSLFGSRFEDISGNGIMIGEGQSREVGGKKWWEAAPEQVASDNTIQHCVITACGRQFSGAVGIWCGLTAKTTLRNNIIFNLPYTGISVGWMWSPVPTPCRENIISGNHIHHIMQSLSDGGGIYMLGLQPGSKITGNLIHDVNLNVGRAESNGMFLDEGTTDVEVTGNLIYKIAKSPIRFHRANSNLVQDNVLFCGDGIPPIRYNNTKEEDIKQIDNQVFSEKDESSNERLLYFIDLWKRQRQMIYSSQSQED